MDVGQVQIQEDQTDRLIPILQDVQSLLACPCQKDLICIAQIHLQYLLVDKFVLNHKDPSLFYGRPKLSLSICHFLFYLLNSYTIRNWSGWFFRYIM